MSWSDAFFVALWGLYAALLVGKHLIDYARDRQRDPWMDAFLLWVIAATIAWAVAT